MEFAQTRELVRLRHELRRLIVDRRTDEARAVLSRFARLAEADAEEAQELRPELARWETTLSRTE